ncbi:Flp pilus assembly protein TadG [Bradyrhizobium japonicum]|uniref:pilus assembly protein TadG-related protein n=1 Tax=Bradyrhizobium elkanii TaxID=29448 RepID=UPI00039A4965|nr:pilus assembly protein TadG-related protein [Bradyrhizobium elkanii]MCP1730143.1 Flp pilus assembly protein TadG [Bradyrhizobium elkanii]MCS3574272.1 Flp pilus assembly protein TadG [Bradyrhizobium elkanii]MCS3593037.1 Flp pilus assembly protein TadG [Bradyrhizobium elkanii]MCS3622482.1 Flp pilus assembly protein TadG [Bradyrhizobium elkanii]MCW2109051.1 Flp pilus assembly protein TadG [Bradyrhizobium elkanii]
MRNLLRCRRGSAAFATAVALVPLIGMVALGAESGTWYVTKRQAQNAADAGAYSGALTLACTLSSATANCDTAQLYDYRGKEFVARNGFCNAGDSFTGVTCPTGLTQTVAVERGTYAAGTFTSSASGNFVRAAVGQTQPAYLASVLGFSSVDIGATAIAEVQNPKNLCALGLSSNSIALTLGGGGALTGDGCALMSNNTVKYASTPTFSGSGWAVDAVNGCTNSGNCNPGVPYNYSMLPATNPLKSLDTAFSTRATSPSTSPCGGGGNVTNGQTCNLTPNSASGVYSNLKVNSGGTLNLAAGTYFFYNAAVTFAGKVTGTDVTLVLLGDSSISITGGPITLSAPATNSYSSLLNGVLIDDQANAKSSNAVTINGSSSVSLFGAMYFPKVDVTWNGTTNNVNTGCTEVIANTLTINGNANLSTGSCAPGTVAKTQVVALVR